MSQLSAQVVLPQDGYVTAYVGTESDVDVLFDEVTVEHRQGLQVQETQYDPAGLELAGLVAPSPGIRGLNNYRFNGKELQMDLGLNWNHQDWRFLDPTTLHWNGVDPEIENGQESWSPYSFGFDNAVRYSDANGRCPCEGDGPATMRAAPFYTFWPGAGNPVVRGIAGFVYNTVAGPFEAVGHAGVSLAHGDVLPALTITNPVLQSGAAIIGVAQGLKTYLSPSTTGNQRIEMATQAGLATAIAALSSQASTPKTLSRTERLAKFKTGLLDAPEVSSPQAVLKLINKTLNKIEDAHAGPKDRMYGVLDDKYVKYHENGNVTARTKGHQINIESDGGFTITNRKDGSIFVDKTKGNKQ